MAAADFINILQQTGGITAIAQQLGIPPAMAEAGAGALLPAIVGGMSKQANAAGGGEGGLGSLAGILGSLGGAGLADNVLSVEPTDVSKGNDVLGTIFGSKEVSRTVADHASGQTGIDPAILKKMLPILAMLAAGYFSHQAGGGRVRAAGSWARSWVRCSVAAASKAAQAGCWVRCSARCSAAGSRQLRLAAGWAASVH